MFAKIMAVILGLSCWAICWIAGFTKPDDANIFVEVAPWVGGAAWITFTVGAVRAAWRHKRMKKVDYTIKKSAEFASTAQTYVDLGMREEALGAIQEASRLSSLALELLDGKGE